MHVKLMAFKLSLWGVRVHHHTTMLWALEIYFLPRRRNEKKAPTKYIFKLVTKTVQCVQRWRFNAVIIDCVLKLGQIKHICTLEYICYWFTAISSSRVDVWDGDVADKQCHFHEKKCSCHVQQLRLFQFRSSHIWNAIIKQQQSNYLLNSMCNLNIVIIQILKKKESERERNIMIKKPFIQQMCVCVHITYVWCICVSKVPKIFAVLKRKKYKQQSTFFKQSNLHFEHVIS